LLRMWNRDLQAVTFFVRTIGKRLVSQRERANSMPLAGTRRPRESGLRARARRVGRGGGVGTSRNATA
jgi:hypothetical protein